MGKARLHTFLLAIFGNIKIYAFIRFTLARAILATVSRPKSGGLKVPSTESINAR